MAGMEVESRLRGIRKARCDVGDSGEAGTVRVLVRRNWRVGSV
jgi:hypothetical protein